MTKATATRKGTKKSEPQRKYITVFKSGVADIKIYNSDILPPPDPNKRICLDANTETLETDKDIIQRLSYRLNNPMNVLINESETSRSAIYNKKRGIKKIPRRQNAWILYRRDKSSEFEGYPSAIASKKISEMWSEESREIKRLFEALARMAIKKHIEKHGMNYKYKPKKSSQKKSEQVINQNESLNLSEEHPIPTNLPVTPDSSSDFEEQQYPVDLSVTSHSNFEEPSPGLIMNPPFPNLTTSNPITSPQHSTNNIYLSYYSN